MVDWLWIYNPHFKFLAGYAKPKEASEQWAIHLIQKQDGLACGSNRDMLFNFKWWFCFGIARTFYVPSFSQNLILVSRLVPFGYSFHFSETSFSLTLIINLIVLGMVFCLMVFIVYFYKMIPLIIHYMSKLALKDVL